MYMVLNVLHRILQHRVRVTKRLRADAKSSRRSLLLLQPDHVGVGVRRVVPTLFCTRHQHGFYRLEPNAGERHCHGGSDMLDSLPVTGTYLDGIHDCAVPFSDCQPRTLGAVASTRSDMSDE
jgi:hypothetical protein